jgi:hypothetical protein
MEKITRKTELGEFTINIPNLTSIGNCGARLLGNVSGTCRAAKLDAYGWATMVKIARSEFFKIMDEENVLKKLKANGLGFIILSDNIQDENKEDKTDWFCTRDFVDYIISRKVGTVLRGLATFNKLYDTYSKSRGSIISSWIWAPDSNLVVPEIEPKLFGAVRKTTIPGRARKFAHGIDMAAHFAKKEDALGEPEPAKAKRTTKRNKAASARAAD